MEESWTEQVGTESGLASAFLLSVTSVKFLDNNQETNKTRDAGVEEGRTVCWKCCQLPLLRRDLDSGAEDKRGHFVQWSLGHTD